MSGQPDRRTLLLAGLAGLASTAGLAAGCSDGSGQPTTGGTASPSGAQPDTASPSASATASQPESWDTLRGKLTGTLVRPGDADYDTARALIDPAFDTIRPQGIAYAASAADVAAAVEFSAASGVPLTARSGGHSYAGYSSTSGLIVDVTRMDGVGVDGNGVATVGAGARLLKVYTDLAGAGRSIGGGSCPTVGISGLTLGGGVGVLGRAYGLTSDQLTGADVVLASGELVRTDATHEPDLFWALRGGGGGNFGIVTAFRFATRAAPAVTLFSVRWPWASAANVLTAWQRWITGQLGSMPDALWSTLVAGAVKGSTPVMRVSGVFIGTPSGLAGPLADLRGAVAATPASSSITQHDYLTAMRIEGGCSATGDCGSTAGVRAGAARSGQHAASGILTAPLSAAGIDTLLHQVEARRTDPLATASGGVILDAWGGEIARTGSADTAFVHRSAIASAQYFAGYPAGASTQVVAGARTWVLDTATAVAPYLSGQAYQNYIDPDLKDWAQAYYGANLPRLKTVKGHYDPDNLFRFAQSIPLG